MAVTLLFTLVIVIVLIVLPLWKIYQWKEASVRARLVAACLVPMLTWIAYFGLQGYSEYLRNSK